MRQLEPRKPDSPGISLHEVSISQGGLPAEIVEATGNKPQITGRYSLAAPIINQLGNTVSLIRNELLIP